MQAKNDKNNPSKAWSLLPLAGAAYLLLKKRQFNNMKKQQEGYELMAQDKMTQLDKVKVTLIYVEQCLLPALQSYLTSIKDL